MMSLKRLRTRGGVVGAAAARLRQALAGGDLALARTMFDAEFYRSSYPDVSGTNEALLKHYMTVGWQEGRDPGPGFSTSHYLLVNGDVAASGLNPLIHYLRFGRAEGRQPLSLGHDLAPDRLDRVRPHFDAAFYRAANPDLGGSDEDLLFQFMTHGWREGRDPSPEFSIRRYLEAYPDVAGGERNPFLHYIETGQAEGRGPRGGPMPLRQADLDFILPHFDPAFYRERYPDVTGSDIDLAQHYMTDGWREHRDPSREFSTAFYLNTYVDIRRGGLNPFLHYLLAGRAEGRLPREGAVPIRSGGVSKAELDAVRPHFDAEFYRGVNTDLRGSDDELLAHFMSIGWREGRDPSPDFSVVYYLDTYGDIAANGSNPFLHYVLFGRNEGRRALGEGAVRLGQTATPNLVPAHLRSVLVRPAAAPAVQPPAQVNPKALDIHWVVPDFARGGGGHMTIFRMVRHLELFGHRCKVWIEAPRQHSTSAEAYDDIVKHFQFIAAEVGFVPNGFLEASGDAVIATGWSTAHLVAAAPGFAGRYYFVQDHEPEFYPTGSESLLARTTYGLDLACICASPWLEGIMRDRYGRWARHFMLAYDPDVYRIIDQKQHQARFAARRAGPFRIAVYARGHTARRCVHLALMALQILGEEGAPIEVHFFGEARLPFAAANFPAFNHGVLEGKGLADLYNACDLGLCFSATNYSLVPQEMMACGLPLLELDTDSTRAIFPPDVVTLAGPDPLDVADKLRRLITDRAGRERQARAARAWVAGFSWEGAARAVEAAILDYLGPERQLAAPAVAAAKETALDVVIPTYNGLAEVKPVIEALRRQHASVPLQIFCVDSSSTDGTTEWLRKQPDVALTVIDQKAFQHGRTRNLGAGLGRARHIAMLTQDARPATATWAHDIVRMLDRFPNAAGLIGRHLPYPDHPLYVREEINRHFDNLLRHPLALSKFTDPAKWDRGDRGWRQLLHFYSDNNSAMRRKVWEQIPYPEVDYGEDQAWAWEILQAGHVKLYCPTAAVYHSHDYGPDETYARSRTESAFFFRQFGYRLVDGPPEQIVGRVQQEQRALLRWARRHGLGPDETERRRANIAARFLGWQDGAIEDPDDPGARYVRDRLRPLIRAGDDAERRAG